MKIWLEARNVIKVENELNFWIEERWYKGKTIKTLIIHNAELPLAIGMIKGKKQLSKIEILSFAKYYADKHDFLKKFDEFRIKNSETFGNHIDLIASGLRNFAENNSPKEELEKFLKFLENLAEKDEKIRKMKKELNEKLTDLDYNFYYYENENENLKLLLFKHEDYQTKPTYYLFAINKETKEVEFKKTKSLTTIYNILFENRINQIGRLQDVGKEDLKQLGEKFIFYLKSLIFDYDDEIKKRILSAVISSNL